MTAETMERMVLAWPSTEASAVGEVVEVRVQVRIAVWLQRFAIASTCGPLWMIETFEIRPPGAKRGRDVFLDELPGAALAEVALGLRIHEAVDAGDTLIVRARCLDLLPPRRQWRGAVLSPRSLRGLHDWLRDPKDWHRWLAANSRAPFYCVAFAVPRPVV